MKNMFTLDAKSRKSIFETTGMTVEQIIDTDFEDLDAQIAKKVGHKIKDILKMKVLLVEDKCMRRWRGFFVWMK